MLCFTECLKCSNRVANNVDPDQTAHQAYLSLSTIGHTIEGNTNSCFFFLVWYLHRVLILGKETDTITKTGQSIYCIQWD